MCVVGASIGYVFVFSLVFFDRVGLEEPNAFASAMFIGLRGLGVGFLAAFFFVIVKKHRFLGVLGLIVLFVYILSKMPRVH